MGLDHQQRIAIIGGGASGTLVAWRLHQLHAQAHILLIEPHDPAGLGLAYSTPYPHHLLNVPAGRISALPEDPQHFLRWLRLNHDPFAQATDFAPRMVYGRYLRDLLATASSVEVRRAAVTGLQVENQQATLTLNTGDTVTADFVVLALGNQAPAPLPQADPALQHPAWSPSTYADLPPDAPVVLIGTGLTAVDVLLQLRANGHRGPVTAFSRRGRLPAIHAPSEPLAEPILAGQTPRTARALLSAVHNALKGHPWRSVVDSLRDRTNELWQALPYTEQRRFLRHLASRWEVVRHRMAPHIGAQIAAERDAGTFRVLRAHLHDATADRVVLRQPDGTLESIPAARIINCTGPSQDIRRQTSPLIRNLLAQGLLKPGPHHRGFATDADGALLDQDGNPSDLLFTLGPTRQGTLLESIAIPEIRQQAANLAHLLARRTGEMQPACAFSYVH